MTPTILLFFSLCALCSFVLAYLVIYPWITGSPTKDNRLMALNVDTFYGRLAELEEDKQAGLISDEFYQTQVLDLKRQLLAAQAITPSVRPASIKSRLIVLIWVPILAAMAYMLIGDRTDVFKLWQAQDSVGQVADELMSGKIDTPPNWATEDSPALMSAIQTNVHRHAYDANRWMRLSEVYLKFEAMPQALEALARAYRLEPDNDDIAGTYAQVSFFANEGRLDATARQVLAKMLAANPDHEGALMLMAMGETQAGNYEAAKAWVQRLRSNIAAKSGDRRAALASLDDMLATIDQKAAAQAGSQVAITVEVATTLLPQIHSQDVLFVAIRDEAGGPPYAVVNTPVSVLQGNQAVINLSDADAMMPNRTLSAAWQSQAKLVAIAKISRSGDAVSQSGDLTSMQQSLSANTKQLRLVIDTVVP